MVGSSDPIKEAFQRAKQDVESLRAEVRELKQMIVSLQDRILQPVPTHVPVQPTESHAKPTQELTELNNMPLESLKVPFKPVSTGNEGVPTNQPTNQQTNQRTGNRGVDINTNFIPTDKSLESSRRDEISHLAHVADILKSLDGLKKEVRIKFKRLTDQEMAVFSAIYTLEETGYDVTYEILAKTLNLTQISIRDYVRKLVEKGIPVDKTKENNKRIVLTISSHLKQIASLATIQQLRSL